LAPVAIYSGSRCANRSPDGWSSIKNGELLRLVSKEFDVFVTVDRNLSFQQNVKAMHVAVIVLRARSNRLSDLLPVVPELLAAIAGVTPGEVRMVGKSLE
jgi:hypothetical protein